MPVTGIAWVGSRTDKFEETVAFLRDSLGLRVDLDDPNSVVLSFPDGDAFEVFPTTEDEHEQFGDNLVAAFLVDDVDDSRAQLEQKGVEFLGPIYRGEPGKTWGDAWCHFRAPDGHLYGLVSRPEHHPGGAPRKFRELRLIMAVDDLDAAIQLYQDGFGLPVVDQWQYPTGERGVLFAVCPASIEILDRAQLDFLDQAEVGRKISGPVALRFEVEDLEGAAAEACQAGATKVADAVLTPWNQHCLRLQAPDGMQLTLFTLDPEEEAARISARALLPN